jgi:hypothetical protein
VARSKGKKWRLRANEQELFIVAFLFQSLVELRTLKSLQRYHGTNIVSYIFGAPVVVVPELDVASIHSHHWTCCNVSAPVASRIQSRNLMSLWMLCGDEVEVRHGTDMLRTHAPSF